MVVDDGIQTHCVSIRLPGAVVVNSHLVVKMPHRWELASVHFLSRWYARRRHLDGRGWLKEWPSEERVRANIKKMKFTTTQTRHTEQEQSASEALILAHEMTRDG